MADLEEAIQVSRRAVQATPKDDPQLIGWLNNLGNDLERRYERIGQVNDLEEAIQMSRQAIQVAPNNHPEMKWLLNSLGDKLRRLYEQRGQAEDLGEAIQVYQQATNTPSGNYLNLKWLLSGLKSMLEIRYDQTGQIEDLEEAIRVSRQVIQATPTDHPGTEWLLYSLGNKLEHRYEQRGQAEDLEEAIQLSRQVIQTTYDHPRLPELLHNLGTKLTSRYERAGRMDDIEEAIQVSRQAVSATLHRDLILAKFLNSLSHQLGCRYKRVGRLEDLEEAILLYRQAIEITKTTTNDYQNLAVLFNGLGNSLESRYIQKGQLDDLEEAILLSRQAVEIISEDHVNLVIILNGLGNQLGLRYDRTAQVDDLEEAIQLYRRAIRMFRKTAIHGHLTLAGLLNNLGSRLESRFKQRGQIEDLEEAIQLSRQAVQATPDDHPDHGRWLNNLANILEKRFEETSQKENLKEAIHLSRKAVQSTPENHPQRATLLYNLGLKLANRYNQTGQIENLEEAIQVSYQAFEAAPSPPLERITAATLALQLLIKQGDYSTGYTLTVEAIELLKLAHHSILSFQDRQYIASHFSGIATQACSLALQIGQPLSEALRLLESGRGVVLSLLMNDRSDTAKLKDVHPALCAQYESLQLEVNTPLESPTTKQTHEPISTRRPKAIEELQKCIQEIRHLPGYISFQQGPTAEQIQNAADEDNIVMVNVTELRSDAIIICSSGISLVPLPTFSTVQAQGWINQNLTIASSRRETALKNKAYCGFLSWLWHHCVKPVLSEISQFSHPSPENLPRVWWIGTGLASSFPFHAACETCNEPTTERTFNRVLSSYTLSIKALLHAREQISISIPSRKDTSKLLMVTMATTPGANNLPGVKAEKFAVLEALSDSIQLDVLDQPDSASVIRRIRGCNIAHFACHGISDPIDPSQSGLILQTATANPMQDVLSVLRLCENHSTCGEIAYLSACSTAESKAERLMDEALHVVSGFQVAGFRHVIGTLWPSDDNVCVEVARSFYTELYRNGALEYTDRTVAMALHKAVLAVSTSVDYRKRPLYWAQYVHYGA
ncbi:hypothetical protein N7509_001143 [Penicillium cosmopolitanum]|uniref:CHAT domain-containing protein n=1 Tax=Penicillium cosmopolitanum TaxID=1131564 RepID=A0A9W9WBL6_9EURO|nr:uncharacterized protein N7509_001143 [Penicillium cosmopolitanum]KAJ5414516.1 hypothetical protein N7509_001143 [Penicillium cosmopolitanum]